MSTIDNDILSIKASLKETGDQLRTYAERAQKEMASNGQLSAETRAKVDEFLTAQSSLNGRMDYAEKVLSKLESGNFGKPAPVSVGQFISAHADLQGVSAGFRGSRSIDISAALINGGGKVAPARLPGIVVPAQRVLTIRDLCGAYTTTSNAVEFVKETGFTNSADVVAENTEKPESLLTLAPTSAAVATIAHWTNASKQILSDFAGLEGYIDNRLMYGLELKVESQLLNGDGTGLNINGLRNQATAYANPGVTVVAETKLDRVRLAMLQVSLAEYTADGIVINPIDWADIELTKDVNGQYIVGSATAQAQPMLWGMPVIATQAIPVNNWLAGAFKLGAGVHDREQANVTISSENKDNFTKNMVTLLAETRLALTVFRPESFVKGDFTGV